jgi:hypothetical protein
MLFRGEKSSVTTPLLEVSEANAFKNSSFVSWMVSVHIAVTRFLAASSNKVSSAVCSVFTNPDVSSHFRKEDLTFQTLFTLFNSSSQRSKES